jgi:glycosyltransferase involved in cell wall biosynthesis
VPLGPELYGLYRDAHAFVHVSWTEGVPGVVSDALACGLPTIATDVGGVRGAVGDGEAALLVPPGDEDALTRAVLQLDDDPQLRRRLAEAGLEISRRNSLEATAGRVADFISVA